MNKIRIFTLIVLFLILIFQRSFADELLPINIEVYSSNEIIKKIAEEVLIEKFNQTKKVKIVDRPAICKLVVVLEPTIESNLNKNGVIISVAHASTFDFFILHAMAQKFEKSTESQLQRKIEELYQNGATTLEYINVAHVDVPSRDNLNKVFSVVVQRFMEKQVLLYEEAFK